MVRSQTRWPTDIKIVVQVNDEDIPLDKEINMRLSRFCGLGGQQRVPLTLERFDDLTKMKRTNSSKTIFKLTLNIQKS
jgi:hypothetical protein